MSPGAVGLAMSIVTAISAAIGGIVGFTLAFASKRFWRHRAEQLLAEVRAHRAPHRAARSPLFPTDRRAPDGRAQETMTPD